VKWQRFRIYLQTKQILRFRRKVWFL